MIKIKTEDGWTLDTERKDSKVLTFYAHQKGLTNILVLHTTSPEGKEGYLITQDGAPKYKTKINDITANFEEVRLFIDVLEIKKQLEAEEQGKKENK